MLSSTSSPPRSIERKSSPAASFISHQLSEDGSDESETPTSFSRCSSSPTISQSTSLLGSSLESSASTQQQANIFLNKFHQNNLFITNKGSCVVLSNQDRAILDINFDQKPIPDLSLWQKNLFALTIRSTKPIKIMLPESLAECENLHMLHLMNVEAENFPRLVKKLTNLRDLTIHHPEMEHPPTGLDHLPNLRQVSFNGCKKLSRLPKLNTQQIEQLTIDIQGTALAKEHAPVVWFLLAPCFHSAFSGHVFSELALPDIKVSQRAKEIEPLLNYIPDFHPFHAKETVSRAALISRLGVPFAGIES